MAGKGSSKFQESLRFAEVTLSEIPSVCAPPPLTWSYHLMQVSRNYIVLFIVLSWTFKMMVCVETLFVLDQHLVVNLGKTTASDSVVKGNGRDCQI